MIRRFLNITFAFLVLAIFAVAEEPPRRPGGEIKIGKWVGYLKIDGSGDAIAVKMDSLLVKPNPKKDFEFLMLIFKLNLGGYGSSEYETEIFEDLQYDYDQNILTLDEPKN